MTKIPTRLRYLPLLALPLVALWAIDPGAAADKAAAPAPAGASAPAAKPASLTVTTDTVKSGPVAGSVLATGTVAAHREVALGAEASGLLLTDVLVRQGDHVEAGEVVARLDDSLLKAEIAEQDAAIASAKATLASAEASNARGQKLVKTGAVSAETAQDRETTVATSQAALAQAEAVRRTLEVQLARTEIKAPFAGVVSARPAVPGGIVQQSTEIVRIQEDGALEARVDVPEQYLSAIRPGAPATVTGPDKTAVTAAVTSVDQTVDATSHLGTVVIALGSDSRFKAGMFVSAAIQTGGTDALTVAQSALTWKDGKTAVFKLAGDDTVALTPVTTGQRAGGRVAVAGNLAAGDRVVASGAGFLDDGNRVRVVTEEASAEGTGQ
ncbi:efflux RND transporter periplasmic adaptor subunit [Jiella sp. M17.18]|uniref:efflux RND transporter periplasmic adaptor subunit n=1 Tax=Jiella sp. M17.18 TaxID=3234247 RepID=UPI0034DF22D7